LIELISYRSRSWADAEGEEAPMMGLKFLERINLESTRTRMKVLMRKWKRNLRIKLTSNYLLTEKTSSSNLSLMR
jgi:hypothetical protein